jgi:hypothetical protein
VTIRKSSLSFEDKSGGERDIGNIRNLDFVTCNVKSSHSAASLFNFAQLLLSSSSSSSSKMARGSMVSPRWFMRLRDQAKPCVGH